MGNNTSTSPGDPDHHFAPPSRPSNSDYRHARWPRFSDPPSQPIDNTVSEIVSDRAHPDVVVVGVCSSGKSTLVKRLKEAGYDARACSQEHSYIPHLWQLSEPRLLIYLDASLHTIRRRRRTKWQQAVLDEEHRRLAHARKHADLYVSTDGLTPDDVASRVISMLRTRRPKAEPAIEGAK